MSKRKSLSKKVRFEVFKRDQFTCQYCGSTPPKAILEVDHINPVFNGGSNDFDNLITACFDCNRGKGKNKLSEITPSLEEKSKVIAEKQAQLKEYEKLLSRKKASLTRKANQIESVFSQYFSGYSFTDTFIRSVKSFLEKLPKSEVEDAMMIACERFGDHEQAIKYFCGICWRKVKESEK